MRLLGKSAIVLGLAGAMALGSMTASEARGHRGAFVAGAAGFAAGAAIGAAAASSSYNNGYYYGDPGYDAYGSAAYGSYGYTDNAGAAYTGDPSYAYSRGYQGYGYYGQNAPMRERVLEGHDY